MKKIVIGVADFALPSPMRGSIDTHSGFGGSKERGQEIHLRYQAKQSKACSDYRPEYEISYTFERDGFTFEVSGRMDGFYENSQKIEEIKTGFNVYDLSKRLRAQEGVHPYVLQLKTYGYFYFLQTGLIPELCLHLISSRNGDSIDLGIKLDPDNYEEWLELRLTDLVNEARAAEKRSQRRKKSATQLQFPFERPRPGQVELIQTIEKGFRGQEPLMIQAPTGLGKTIGVVYPLLRESLSRGEQLIYVTPKNSQHGVAEDAIVRLRSSGAKLKSMTLTAKTKMCLKKEAICNPDFCEFAKDHYTKVALNNLNDKMAKKKKLTAKAFKKMGQDYEVCPYELQIEAARNADMIICDYNYVFAPRSALARVSAIRLDQEGKPNLAVDEAHNLVSRSLDYYSPELSVDTLEKMRSDITFLPEKFRKKTMDLLNSCIVTIQNAGPFNTREPSVIDAPTYRFAEQDMELRDFLSTYLNSDVEINERDPVMRLCFYWSEFTAALQFVDSGRKEFFTTFHSNPATIKITCCDASAMLKECYARFTNVVSFSATLKPFQYYKELSGLSELDLKTTEFMSPFPKENRKLLLIPQISSKYSERERNYQKIADVIEKVSALKRGNYFAFFPSFEFMSKVMKIFRRPEGFEILVQQPQMRADAINEILEKLSEKDSAYILFGVQGGVLSEGIDYPGDMAIGAFIVGPPLPHFNLEREKMREYYQERYEAGFEYAYTYPAMAKAVQAAGRVIRSEEDKGLIVLMDSRFAQVNFSKSMPTDWFDESPAELVSTSILKDVTDFWAN